MYLSYIMYMEVKIGVGIITCNRPQMLANLLDSVPFERIQELVVINDGDEIDDVISDTSYAANIQVFNTGKQGVGKAKNVALRYLLEQNCDYIFLIEDDMRIKNADIFNEYINASKVTGIQHFLFGYHGPANKNGVSGGVPCPRCIIDYGDNVKIALNQHCVGAFCMYTKKSLDEVGLLDETFHNVWEHVEHSLRLCKQSFAPGYWWWPDIHNSIEYIKEQACSEQSSSIRNNPDWMKNIREGMAYFKSKHQYSPVEVPDATPDEIKHKLKEIWKANHV